MAKKIFLNEKLFDEDDAKISVLDSALLYGYGAYETLRAYDGVVFRLDEHIERIIDSLKALEINTPYSKKQVKEAVYSTLEGNDLKEAAMRVTITAGGKNNWGSTSPSLVVLARPAPAKAESMTALTVPFHRDLAVAKSLNCMTSMIAQKQAAEKGFDEAFFTNCGMVLEGTTSNVFCVKDREIFSPKNDVLHGITRKVVIGLAKKMGLAVKEGKLRIKSLYLADEVFITGTLKEIVPIVKVDEMAFKTGEITGKLQEEYAEEVVQETAAGKT
ncbi:aminotransferase class IV [Candidatus Micrarchaeota archaeon]|nr:aminotransferase class IV [Candidatus Micrarchaeota archaeon]